MEIKEWLGADNELGISIWQRKYQKNDETLDEWFDRVSGNNPKVKKLIKEKKFLPGGRTLSNRGLHDKASLFNCYSRGFVEDDYNDIMNAAVDIGKTFKGQGGQGISLSKIRPKGTPIGEDYFSDGIIPFMKIYNEVTAGTSQGGARKGALMLSIDATHKQAKDFITIKSDNGIIEKANLSLEIDDNFMTIVKKYFKTGNKEFIHKREDYSGHIIEYDVDPVEVFNLLVDNCYDWGDPAVLFTNRFRNYNIMEKVDSYQIETCNPCFTGDTIIAVADGRNGVAIKDLVGTEFPIYSAKYYKGLHNVANDKWTTQIKPAIAIKTGTKHIITVVLSDNSTFRCTPEHLLALADGGYIEAENSLNCRLGKFFTFSDKNSNKNYRHIKSFPSNRQYRYIADYYNICDNTNNTVHHINHIATDDRIENLLPISFEEHMKEFANGQRLHNTITKDANFIYNQKLKQIKANASKYNWDENRLAIEINAYEEKYTDGYIVKEDKNIYLNQEVYVANIIDNNEVEDVYDIIVEDNHNFYIITNTDDKNYLNCSGVLVHNCGEQPLPKHGACCLASLNLSEFVVRPYTKYSKFNMEDFINSIDIGIDCLDDLISENYYRHPLKEQQEMSYNYRNIGLGMFGYATALMKLGIRYGSKECINFTKQVFDVLFREAVSESSRLAKAKGCFPKYDKRVWESSIIKNHFSSNEIEVLKSQGLRNCSLISIAPTGTLANLLGESGGCEPEYAIEYTRRTIGMTDGEDTYYKVYCKAAREFKELNPDVDLPDYFVSSADINPLDRVKVQATMQKHVDTAISSTVNLVNSATKEDIRNIYLSAWELGCKGITIFRDGCKKTGILTTDNTPKQEIAIAKIDVKSLEDSLPRGFIYNTRDTDMIGIKRTLITGCVDCDTEFFTGNGWKKISEYQQGDSVLQYNEDGSAQLVYPQRYIKRKSEKSYHIKSRNGLDMVVSHDHRNVTFNKYNNKLEIYTTDEIIEKHNSLQHGFNNRFKLSFDYSGDGINLTDDEIRLCIAVFADGSFHGKKLIGNKCTISVKKLRKRNRLIEILNRLSIPYEEIIDSKNYHKIYFYPPLLKVKHFPSDWYNCNKHQLSVIFDEVFHWDGCDSLNNEFTTTCKADADFIQFVCASLGFRGSLYIDDRTDRKLNARISYKVSHSARNYTSIVHSNETEKISIEEYTGGDGYDYCFTVPSGMLVLRRNNRIFITGNCGKLHMTSYWDEETGDLLEVFLDRGKDGGCNSFMIGLSRMISLAARGGIDFSSIVDQLTSTYTCPSYAVRKATKHDVSKGNCCPTAVGNALLDVHKQVMSMIKEDEEINTPVISTVAKSNITNEIQRNDLCPECGAPLKHEGGCLSCSNCGYSKCG